MIFRVFPEGRRVRVSLPAARHRAGVRLLISKINGIGVRSGSDRGRIGEGSETHRVEMSPLVLRPVGGVGERLQALGELAEVGPLSRVRAEVDLQILQSGERLRAAWILQGDRLSFVFFFYHLL